MEAVLTHEAIGSPQALGDELCSCSTSLSVSLRVGTKRFLESDFLSPNTVSHRTFSTSVFFLW